MKRLASSPEQQLNFKLGWAGRACCKDRLNCERVDSESNRAGFRTDMYGLLTKCEVKMAGYWLSSFFACLWTETQSRSINSQKKNEANTQLS